MSRKKAEDFILKYLNEILPGNKSVEIYKDKFSKMSDKEFDVYMNNLKSEIECLVLYAPSFTNKKLSVENNLRIAKEIGHEFFERIWIGAKNSVPEYLTPIKYLIIDLPVKRVSQLLTKKIKIPLDNKKVDMLTGQPTSDSKGAKISFDELKILSAMGLDNNILELIKFRGGDLKGFNAMNAMISRYGSCNLEVLDNFSSGVESTKVFNTFLTAMHIKSTL